MKIARSAGLVILSMVSFWGVNSCSKKLSCNDIESIRFIYLLPMMTDTPIQSREQFAEYTDFLKDTVFYSRPVLNSFCKQINKLESSTEPDIYDFRILSIINFKGNPEKLEIMFDSFNYYAFYNGNKMKGDESLTEYFYNLLYKSVPDWGPEI